MDKSALQIFGDWVRKERQQKGLSQEGLADSCGMHRTYLGGIERGERNASLVNVFKLCQALGFDLPAIAGIASAAQESGAEFFPIQEIFSELSCDRNQVFWLYTPDFSRLIYISKTYEYVWGCSRASLYESPHSYLAAIHADDIERVRSAEKRLVKEGIFQEDYRITRPDGTIRWIADRGFSLRNHTGEIIALCGCACDITESKEKEEELQQLHYLLKAKAIFDDESSLFKLVLDKLNDAVFVTDTDGRFVITNPQAKEMAGLPIEEVEIKDFPEYFGMFKEDGITPYKADEVPLRQALATGRTNQATIFLRNASCPEGKWIEGIACPLKDATGAIQGATAVFQDITQRKHTQEKLQQSSRLFQSVLESMADGVIVADRDHNCILFNRAAAVMLGKGGSRVQAESFPKEYGVFLPDCVTPFPVEKLALLKALAGQPVDNQEFVIRKSERPYDVWASASARPLTDSAGEPSGAVMVFRDITGLKRDREQACEIIPSLREILDLMNDCIIVHDCQKGLIVEANQKACQTLGYSLEEIKSAQLPLFLIDQPPHTIEEVLERIRNAAAVSTPSEDWLCQASDGRIFPMEASLKRAVLGGREYILTIMQDMSVSKAAERNLRLLKIMQQRENYARRLAFDLKAPLVGMHSVLAHMGKDCPGGETELPVETLRHLEKTNLTLINTVQEMLALLPQATATTDETGSTENKETPAKELR